MHKPSLLRKLENDGSQANEKEDLEHQDRVAKVLMFHSKGYSHPEILGVIKDYSSIEKGVHKIADQDFYCEEHLDIASKLLSVSKKNCLLLPIKRINLK